MKTSFLTIFLFTALASGAQINMADSTAQAVTYWQKGDTQLYSVTNLNIKLNGPDTVSKYITSCDVKVTVLDVSDSSYTIEWLYSNFVSDNTEEKFQKLVQNQAGNEIPRPTKVIYKTDEFGIFQEVVNWEEVRDGLLKALNLLKQDDKSKNNPDADKILKQLEMTFATREAIESVIIKDILQFHIFYGGIYKMGEPVKNRILLPNIVTGGEFDADYIVSLEEINEEDNHFTISSLQVIDEEQMANAIFTYLTRLYKDTKTDLPKREDLEGQIKNETLTTSIIHTTGWVVHSEQTATSLINAHKTIDSRIIELK